MRSKPFAKYVFFPLVMSLALLARMAWRAPDWWGAKVLYERLGCALGWSPTLSQGLHEGFEGLAAPPQNPADLAASGLRLEATDTPGWSLLTPAEGRTSASLRVRVRAAGEELLFFPRVSGADALVEVSAQEARKPRLLARLQGKPEVWSSIAARWRIPLTCLERDKPVELTVTLAGRWAQLWIRDGAVFFEPVAGK